MTRLGLIGVGAWGKRYVATIDKREDCELVAIARASPRSETHFGGVRLYPRWQDLVTLGANQELDGLIVATTPDHQAEVVAVAIEAGVPVLAEKPLGFNRCRPEALLASWKDAKLPPPVMVNFVHLWAPAYRALVRRIREEGGASAVASIVTAGCSTGPFRGWSSLYDYGPHDCAMLAGLLGADRQLRIVEAHRSETEVGPDAELFEFQLYLDDVRVVATLGNGSPRKRRLFAVTLRNGSLLIYDDTRPLAEKLSADGVPVALEATMPLEAVVAGFLESIRRWRGRGPAEQAAASEPERNEAALGLALSCDVARMLDALAAAVNPAPDGRSAAQRPRGSLGIQSIEGAGVQSRRPSGRNG